MIYLDHNATAPVLPSVREAVAAVMETHFANPSSPYAAARAVRKRIDAARRQVAASVGAAPSEVVFTSGGTEAIHAAVLGCLRAQPGAGPHHVVTTAIEHPATLAACELARELGLAEVDVVPVGPDGHWHTKDVVAALRPDTVLVTVMLANNETGVLCPVAELAAALADHPARLHVDAVQAWGKVPIDVAPLGADYLSLSAHKIGGLKGCGALVVRRGAPMRPWLGGGHQERGQRGGTENVPGIVAMGAAAAEVPAMLDRAPAIAALRDRLERGLIALGDTRINGTEPRVPNTTSVTLGGIDAEGLLVHLDLEGIQASSAAACTTGTGRPSHVLLAMGRTPAEALGSLRLSLGPSTTPEDIDQTLATLTRLVHQMRAQRP